MNPLTSQKDGQLILLPEPVTQLHDSNHPSNKVLLLTILPKCSYGAIPWNFYSLQPLDLKQ